MFNYLYILKLKVYRNVTKVFQITLPTLRKGLPQLKDIAIINASTNIGWEVS